MPPLTTLVAYIQGVCHASFSTVRKFIRDVIGFQVSRGNLRKLIGKESEALKASYGELLAALPNENTLYTMRLKLSALIVKRVNPGRDQCEHR